MERLQRASILLTLNEELRRAGSWAGETHMQKATYFLQELTRIPLEFDFVLYKHGPFSFDLRDEGLERTATALYIMLRDPNDSDRVRRLTDLKPHIAFPEAQAAISEVEQIIHEIRQHRSVSHLSTPRTA
jgi:hypothetical protein